MIYNSETNRWIEGDLSRQNLIASSDAGLSAVYWQCAICTNTTIIAYQDVNSFVQIGNRTTTDWVFTQLNLNPIQNTGLALQIAFTQGISAQINFYYQKSNLNLTQAWWLPAFDDKSGMNSGPCSFFDFFFPSPGTTMKTDPKTLDSQIPDGSQTCTPSTLHHHTHPSPQSRPLQTPPQDSMPGSNYSHFPPPESRSTPGRE